jgi:D-alanine-D-alanine ligase
MAAMNAVSGSAGYQTARPMNVLVLCGGPSAERDISLMSGAVIADALTRAGHATATADVMPDDVSALDATEADVVFIAMHGEFGESGEVQALCDARELKYVGSGALASRIAMDKAQAKTFFAQAGLATPAWLVAQAQSDDELAAWIQTTGLPVVIKPVDGGSSVDVVIARDLDAVLAARSELASKYERLLLEAFVPGRELTVGVIGDEALAVLEIVPDGTFYDMHAKYDDDAQTQYTFDHGLAEATCRSLREAALRAHQVLGCRDMSRSDFILDADGQGHLLEINTIPGFTTHSLLPMSAAHAGIGIEALVDRLVCAAADRT